MDNYNYFKSKKEIVKTKYLQRFSPQKSTWRFQYNYKLKHPTKMNLKYKGFQQFARKNFFKFVHIFGSGFGPSCDVTRGHEL